MSKASVLLILLFFKLSTALAGQAEEFEMRSDGFLTSKISTSSRSIGSMNDTVIVRFSDVIINSGETEFDIHLIADQFIDV